MPGLRVLTPAGAVLLLGASAWFGLVGGVRRWRPCVGGFDTETCLRAQSHETGYLPELAHPEIISMVLMGGAVLLLALLGRMPVWVRLFALLVGPTYAWAGLLGLASVGRTEMPPPPPGGYQTTPAETVGLTLMLLLPLVMVGVAWMLITRPPDLPGSAPGDRLLGIAWAAVAAGWPMSEYLLLTVVYGSHDSPPGTGLWRSALALLAAVALLRRVVVRTRGVTGAPQATQNSLPSGSSMTT